MVETKEVSVSAGKIVYQQTQPAKNKRNLIFFHGAFGDPEPLSYLDRVFGSEYRITAPFLPGHGSFNLDRKFTYPNLVTTMSEFLDQLHLRNQVLVMGHSFGGRLALDLAVSMNSPHLKEVLFAPMLAPIFPNLTAAVLHIIRDYWKDFRLSGQLPVSRDTSLYKLINIGEIWNLITSVGNITTNDSPAFVIWGERDSVLPLEKNKPQIAKLTESILHVYRGAHFWFCNPSHLKIVKDSLSE